MLYKLHNCSFDVGLLVTVEELTNIMNDLKYEKAAGPDELPADHFECATTTLIPLLSLYPYLCHHSWIYPRKVYVNNICAYC